jgi:hypothetical protein
MPNIRAAIDLESMIWAIRDTQTEITKAEYYSAGAKFTMSNMCERLIIALKNNTSTADFWRWYNHYLDNETDLMCEVMEFVFFKLDVETIDPIVESLD